MTWIDDIQGLTVVLDENGAPVQRRSVISFAGAAVADDGTKTVVTIAGGVGSGIQGRLLRAPQYLTSGTSITHPAGTRLIKVRGVGGGSAGGGCDAAAHSIGAMGASGTYGEKTFTAASLTSTYTIGAAGVGVSGAAGGSSGSSTFTHNGLTVTLPGASGGQFVAGSAASKRAAGGASLGAASNADFSIQGQVGGEAFNTTAPLHSAQTGPGGSNPLGFGAPGRAAIGGLLVAIAGQGFGFGGGGRMSDTTTAAAGAGSNGGPGCWIVEEYS
jgi:hypothetical protein